MTWIGKILTVLVMIAAVVWMFLNVQAFTTRTNWKIEADRYKDAFKKAIDAREADYRAGLTEVDIVRKERDKHKKDLDDAVAFAGRAVESAATVRPPFTMNCRRDMDMVKPQRFMLSRPIFRAQGLAATTKG